MVTIHRRVVRDRRAALTFCLRSSYRLGTPTRVPFIRCLLLQLPCSLIRYPEKHDHWLSSLFIARQAEIACDVVSRMSTGMQIDV